MFARTLGIGAVAGLRAATAPAAVLRSQGGTLATLAFLAALGELIGDKLPFAPARTTPPAAFARVISGAFCGRALAKRFDASAAGGMAAGAIGALAATFVAYKARRYLTVTKGWPDFPVALAEDAAAIAIAQAVCR